MRGPRERVVGTRPHGDGAGGRLRTAGLAERAASRILRAASRLRHRRRRAAAPARPWRPALSRRRTRCSTSSPEGERPGPTPLRGSLGPSRALGAPWPVTGPPQAEAPAPRGASPGVGAARRPGRRRPFSLPRPASPERGFARSLPRPHAPPPPRGVSGH